jgi:hypothetical protein
MIIHDVSLAVLALGLACAAILAVAVVRRPQPMAVMNIVWPVVALFTGPAAVGLYRRFGKAKGKPFWASAAIATFHCGAGCALGDIFAEIVMTAVPDPPVWSGWLLDSVAAFILGIGFQYFAIKPMGSMSAREALWRALKADMLSLTAWQAGMIGLMALVQFGITRLKPAQPEFWFAMQVAMIAGFAFSYPVNRWLLKAGVKEAM